MTTSSPKPWRFEEVKQPLVDNVYFIRIFDADGNKVATLSPHSSVGGRGLEQAVADARLIVAIANSPAAAAFESETRHAAPAEIPVEEQTPAGTTGRLL